MEQLWPHIHQHQPTIIINRRCINSISSIWSVTICIHHRRHRKVLYHQRPLQQCCNNKLMRLPQPFSLNTSNNRTKRFCCTMHWHEPYRIRKATWCRWWIRWLRIWATENWSAPNPSRCRKLIHHGKLFFFFFLQHTLLMIC